MYVSFNPVRMVDGSKVKSDRRSKKKGVYAK